MYNNNGHGQTVHMYNLATAFSVHHSKKIEEKVQKSTKFECTIIMAMARLCTCTILLQPFLFGIVKTLGRKYRSRLNVNVQ